MDRLHSLAAPVVTQRDASDYPTEQLVAVNRAGILQRVLDPEEVPHPRWPDRCRVAVRRTDLGVYAVPCEDEDYFEPFPLKQEDTWVYEVAVPYLVEHLRRDNGITGTGKPVIQGMQLVGRKDLDGFGTVEVFLCLPNDDSEAFRDRCLALRKPGGVKRLTILVPLPVALAAAESELLDGRGLDVVPLLTFTDQGHLRIDWANTVLRANAQRRPDGVYGRTVLVNGIEYRIDLTRREMDFLAVALTCESVPIERIWNRNKKLNPLWEGKFVNDRTNRNTLSRFLTDLNAKLARLTPPFPFFFSLPRGEQVIVRTSETPD